MKISTCDSGITRVAAMCLDKSPMENETPSKLNNNDTSPLILGEDRETTIIQRCGR